MRYTVLMYKALKNILLVLMKYSGIFFLCRKYYRGCPRIICYHGFNIVDESEFIPGTFIRKSTFESRIALLKKLGASFIKLDDVLNRRQEKLPIVLTFDDGFVSTLTKGLPVLEKHGIPGTIYVTTYYAKKTTPIFRLHFQYLLWKCSSAQVNWDDFKTSTPWQGKEELKGNPRTWEIIDYFETHKTEQERSQFIKEFEKILSLSLTPEQRRQSFTIANDEELKEAQASQLDIQLHTHRHRLPLEKSACQREIKENRKFLASINPENLAHFCYPSGIYDKEQFPWLEEAGIATATTLTPGIVKRDSHPLELPRILDSEGISQLQFEAEVCGAGDFLRSFRWR